MALKAEQVQEARVVSGSQLNNNQLVAVYLAGKQLNQRLVMVFSVLNPPNHQASAQTHLVVGLVSALQALFNNKILSLAPVRRIHLVWVRVSNNLAIVYLVVVNLE